MLLVILVMGSKFTSDNTITWAQIIYISIGWIIVNVIYDLILRKKNSDSSTSWITSPMKLGDWKFGLFLLLMSGFWTSFNQIFYTLPLYIRDFVDTTDIMMGTKSLFNFFGLSNELFTSFSNSMAVPGQVNPEYLINLNAGAIIFFQVAISYFVTRLKPFTTIFWGTIIMNAVNNDE